MHIDFLIDAFSRNKDKDAIIWRDTAYKYGWLLESISGWRERLERESIGSGAVISLEADFSPSAIGLLLVLVERGCVIVPLTTSVEAQKPEFRETAEVEVSVIVKDDSQVEFRKTGVASTHHLLRSFKQTGRPGLVLFSSGSTGKSKAAIHDFVSLLEKFKVPRHSYRAVTFLLFDHIGGINTLLYNLANGGCIITVEDRSPDAVCRAIHVHKVELLPTSPTFINLVLVSEAYRRHDLSSLELVTYGTEMMPESTLKRFHDLYPNIRLLQTYGLSEVGILRSKSKSSDSLWVKVGGEGFETRVVDGMLEVKAESAMKGYLNAPSPFTKDGWFKTGDAVEVDGDYMRFLGRKSEVINVGGEKVYPAEVESVLQQIDGVEDVVVFGEKNPITGQMVTARVKLGAQEAGSDFRKRMWQFCKDKLVRYKIPQKVVIADDDLHSERFKRMRR